MKKFYFINWFIIIACFIFFNTETSATSNKYKFTIPSRGVKYYEINVPENAKSIKAVVSGQTGMLGISIYAPGKDVPYSKNSTWFYLSNWRKPLECSVGSPLKAGTWRIKVEGQVQMGNLDKIRTISGFISIYIDDVPIDLTPSKPKIESPAKHIVKGYKFTIPSRGVKYYEVNVPENTKSIKAVVNGQTEMLGLSIFAPGKDIPSCKNTTWSYLSNWRKPLKCSVGRPLKAGTWRIKVEGQVQVSDLDKIKSVSGFISIFIDDVPIDLTSSKPKIKSPAKHIVKGYNFTIPSRGVKYYEINIPENAKKISAVISGQTEMVNLSIFAPGMNIPYCKTTTWSYLSNWRKPLKCSVGSPLKAGIWKVKVEGSVHVGKLDKIKSVSGFISIFIDDVPIDLKSSKPKIKSPAYPIVKEYNFTIPSRGVKYYEINIPENAKKISAVISGQTEMINLSIFAPGMNIPYCKTTTWSYLSNWRKPLECSVGSPLKPGTWKVKIEGQVHWSKLDKIKSISGHLKIQVVGK